MHEVHDVSIPAIRNPYLASLVRDASDSLAPREAVAKAVGDFVEEVTSSSAGQDNYGGGGLGAYIPNGSHVSIGSSGGTAVLPASPGTKSGTGSPGIGGHGANLGGNGGEGGVAGGAGVPGDAGNGSIGLPGQGGAAVAYSPGVTVTVDPTYPNVQGAFVMVP